MSERRKIKQTSFLHFNFNAAGADTGALGSIGLTGYKAEAKGMTEPGSTRVMAETAWERFVTRQNEKRIFL